jgi:gamma-glutamyl-gamma-aminobutyraldehyde dehydrogenase
MMNFQHLAYWQEKAKNLAIETRLFINGEYCAAADNTTFETIDPAAQQTLAQVARGKKADVERAVKAARRALITATGRRPLRSVKRFSLALLT